jgi:SAM-dependent methyltransferase
MDQPAPRYGVDPALANREVRDDSKKISKNPLLRVIYDNIYTRLLSELPPEKYPRLLEVGSGGGFIKEHAPHVMTSDCVPIDGIDLVVDAGRLGEHFAAESLDAITAFNVFHHLPDPIAFLHGARRVLRGGGRVVLIEPWFTPFGQWFYRGLHHEPYLCNPDEWRIVGSGRLAGANSRLPTSVFRDNDDRFRREFPNLRILKREPIHKWLYLLSGGLQFNTHIPEFVARKLVAIDARVTLGNRWFGIFAIIVVERF